MRPNLTIPIWDSNLTNALSAIVAGHSTDGFATNEIPSSGEDNRYRYQIAQMLLARQNDVDPEALAPARLGADLLFNNLNGTSIDSAWAYCPVIGGGCATQGSANNKIKITPGYVMQKVGSQLQSWFFDGTDEVTIANGDPSHPRVDLIQLQISVSAGGVITKSLTVKQGTPAAAPAYPTPDAGTVPMFAVVVPTNYAAGGVFIFAESEAVLFFGTTHPVIHDLRVPLGVQAYRVMPADFSYTLAAGWFEENGRFELRLPATTVGNVMFICPTMKGRLLGFDIFSRGMDNTTLDIRAVDPTGGLIVRLSHNTAGLTNGGTYVNSHQGAATVEVEDGVDAGPVVTGNGTHSPPVWCNGMRSPKMERTIASGNVNSTMLAMNVNSSGTNTNPLEVGAVVFYVAHGL